MRLQDRILSLPKRTPGQHDVVVRASLMASEADELMGEMAATLAGLDPDQLTQDQQDNLIRVLGKYNAYKER